MNARGMYGNGRGGSPRAEVGISLFHTVGDRDRLVDQVQTEFSQLYAELWRKMGGDPDVLDARGALRDPVGWAQRRAAQQQIIAKSPLYPLYKDTFAPVYSEWRHFHDTQGSWQEWKTNWDVYEGWRDRLAALHAHVSDEVARITGDKIRTPTPTEAPRTVWGQAEHVIEHGACAVESGIADVWSVLKYGLLAALGIGAVVALSSVASNTRKGAAEAGAR